MRGVAKDNRKVDRRHVRLDHLDVFDQLLGGVVCGGATSEVTTNSPAFSARSNSETGSV